MKEIIAVVRMNKTNATKKALVEIGAAGFTAIRVMGRGKLVEDPSVIADCKVSLLGLVSEEDRSETETVVDSFLDGTRLFTRRLFNIFAHDEDVPKIVEAIIKANKTDSKVGDGKIFVLPVDDAVRVRTGERGELAVK